MTSAEALKLYQDNLGQIDSASSDLSTAMSDAGSLPGMVKDLVYSRYNNFKPVIDEESTAKQNFFNAPTEARVKYEGIEDPFVRDNLVNKYVNNSRSPYDTARNIRTAVMGGADDIINAATQGFNSILAGKQQRVADLKDKANSALSLYNTLNQNEQNSLLTSLRNSGNTPTSTTGGNQQVDYNTIPSQMAFTTNNLNQLKAIGAKLLTIRDNSNTSSGLPSGARYQLPNGKIVVVGTDPDQIDTQAKALQSKAFADNAMENYNYLPELSGVGNFLGGAANAVGGIAGGIGNAASNAFHFLMPWGS